MFSQISKINVDFILSALLLQLSSSVDVCFVFLLTAVERNNLMRLSQSIPFTPVPPRGKSGSQHTVRRVRSGENPADTS